MRLSISLYTALVLLSKNAQTIESVAQLLALLVMRRLREGLLEAIKNGASSLGYSAAQFGGV
jgi:hypothetical protein